LFIAGKGGYIFLSCQYLTNLGVLVYGYGLDGWLARMSMSMVGMTDEFFIQALYLDFTFCWIRIRIRMAGMDITHTHRHEWNDRQTNKKSELEVPVVWLKKS